MKTLGIIPARLNSSRLPGKVLIDIEGKSMIQRVYEQAIQSKLLSKVIIAADDPKVYAHCEAFGEVMMTKADHQSGTDRCAEVASKMADFEIVINIQGDEPFISPNQIDRLASVFQNNKIGIATLIKATNSLEEIKDPNTVKVVKGNNNQALYFSRAAIPFQRNSEEQRANQYFKHIGMYGYRRSVLLELSKLQMGVLEQIEKLEQLRWMENGFSIHTIETELETLSIDTEEDLEKARDRFR